MYPSILQVKVTIHPYYNQQTEWKKNLNSINLNVFKQNFISTEKQQQQQSYKLYFYWVAHLARSFRQPDRNRLGFTYTHIWRDVMQMKRSEEKIKPLRMVLVKAPAPGRALSGPSFIAYKNMFYLKTKPTATKTRFYHNLGVYSICVTSHVSSTPSL